ncbi:MAG: threonine aldolase [Ruminococcaceae bacterium]|nr:threonine aldolase [Oscillospiraceae bacterium]
MNLFASFSLASDNCSPAHPKLIESIRIASEGYALSYGQDKLTSKATDRFKNIFGKETIVYYAFNGTGANIAALSALTARSSAVICPSTAHINTHETGAPEKLLGLKLIGVPSKDGKLAAADIERLKCLQANFHDASRDIVSISQTTEMGTVYTMDELKLLCNTAHENNMLVHMDGARFANAVAALNCNPKEISRDVGVDVLCFGGTKNGFVFGEAIVFFNPVLAERFDHLHKQHLQLASKNRFIAAQFDEALKDGFWIEMANNANEIASYLEYHLNRIPDAEIVFPVESNQIFCKFPESQRDEIFNLTGCSPDAEGVTRFVTSFCTTKEDIDALAEKLLEL